MSIGAQIDAGGAGFRLTLKDDLSGEIKTSLALAVQSVKAVRSEIDGYVKGIGRSIQSTGRQIAAVGAGLGALGGTATFGFVKAVMAAGDLAETVNMFDAVFKDQSKAVREWGNTYAKTVGRSRVQLMRFLAESQDTFVPLGFDRTEAAELSKTVTKLAIDLGSFKNIDDSEALRSLLGGIIGNTENLRKFGVVAQEAQIKAQALSMGFDPSNLSAYEKALAILEITIAGTADAQGDAIKTAGSFANSIKALKSSFADLKNTVGKPLLDIATSFVKGVTATLNAINSLLERFPILSKLAAGAAFALGAVGIAATGVGLVIASVGKSIGAAGLSFFLLSSGFSLLSNSFGIVGAVAAKASSSLAILRGSVVSVGRSLLSVFSGQALRAGIAVFVNGIKVLVASFTAAVAVMAKAIASLSIKMAAALLNPWVAVLAAIAAATAAAIIYYKRQQQFENERGKRLEQERVRTVGQSFRDAGQAVPADLFKTRDFNNASVVSNGADITKPLSNAQQELVAEIKGIQSALESYRERIATAKNLLARGSIDQAEFVKFAKQELDNFRQADPTTRDRTALAEQLQTPLESFRKSISDASRLFGPGTEMFVRARDAAIEQFRANDAATQLAAQLKTPAETLRDAVERARELFADAPENLRRAIESANQQFRATDPVEQLRIALATPVERFRQRMDEIREALGETASGINAGLFDRASKAAQEQFDREDPARSFAQRVRDQLKTDGAKVADAIRKSQEAVRQGLISRGEATSFVDKIKEQFLGERPDVQKLASIGTSSAFVASQLGQFAPTFDGDRESLEYEKKQAKLQSEIRDAIIAGNKRRSVFN